jgi:predicted phage terminase large subunit-like protein
VSSNSSLRELKKLIASGNFDPLLIKKELAERRLIEFIELTWHIIEPERPFIREYPIEVVCDHLEAIHYGEIVKLLVNVPPGTMKSLATNVFFPAWEWGPRNMPSTRYISFSYASPLTQRDNEKFYRVCSSDIYQRFWGDRVKFVKENITKYENDRTGWKLATSVGGVGTGERGDRLLLDDPHNVKDGESETIRKETVRWFRESLSSRVNDPMKSAFIIIMQRVHEDDVSGTIISENLDYDHLCLPVKFDSAFPRCETSIGFKDERQHGELLLPKRMPIEFLNQQEKELGPYAFAAQYQQQPVPRGGGIIKSDWWQLWKDPYYPNFQFLMGSFDGAFTTKDENDFSAYTVWGVFEDQHGVLKIMLVYAWKVKLELHQVVQKIAETNRKYKVDLVVVENKATGHSVVQELRRLFRNEKWGFYLFDPSKDGGGDKEARLYACVPTFTNEIVYAPDKSWASTVINEVAMAPKGKWKDLSDTVSQAILYMRKRGLISLRGERTRSFAREGLPKPGAQKPLYGTP